MTMLAAIRPLFDHMEWADAMIWRAVDGYEAASADRELHEKLYHIHATQTAFLQAWRHEEVRFTTASDYPSLDDVRQLGRAFYEVAPAFVSSLDDDAAGRELVLPWSRFFGQRAGFDPKPSTLAETLLQLPSHSTYHRGQVNTRLRQVGATPPLVDFIAWVWLGKPEPDWR